VFILEVNIYVMTVCNVCTLYAVVCSSMLYCDLVLENTMKNRIYAYEMLLQFIYTIVSPSPQGKTCLLALDEKVYQVICNFGTA